MNPNLTIHQTAASLAEAAGLSRYIISAAILCPFPCALDGVFVAQRIIAAGRILLAADSLGAADAMIAQAVAYAGQREQFGRVIGSFQAVKHMCAEMAALANDQKGPLAQYRDRLIDRKSVV